MRACVFHCVTGVFACVCVCVTSVSIRASLRAEPEHNLVHSVPIVQFFYINPLLNQHVKRWMFNLLTIWFYSFTVCTAFLCVIYCFVTVLSHIVVFNLFDAAGRPDLRWIMKSLKCCQSYDVGLTFSLSHTRIHTADGSVCSAAVVSVRAAVNWLSVWLQ